MIRLLISIGRLFSSLFHIAKFPVFDWNWEMQRGRAFICVWFCSADNLLFCFFSMLNDFCLFHCFNSPFARLTFISLPFDCVEQVATRALLQCIVYSWFWQKDEVGRQRDFWGLILDMVFTRKKSRSLHQLAASLFKDIKTNLTHINA